jgi:CubicO group peptidase (beta-lactamase class C family)
MPIGKYKNALYALALPFAGLNSHWKAVSTADGQILPELAGICRGHHVVGGCIQRIQNGELTECYPFGYASLSPRISVTADTYFRTASVAKMVCAVLVMRLQTLGRLDVNEDISAFWGEKIRNPFCPETPIPLSALLSHTSGLLDSPLYFQSYQNPVSVSDILSDGGCFSARRPGEIFRYSNFAAGLIGCLLEKRFGESLETLAQRELFIPLGMNASFDLLSLPMGQVANSYRVLPASSHPSFSAEIRIHNTTPLDAPDPEHHYLLASGGLFLTAEAMARLTLPLLNGGCHKGNRFLSPETVVLMKTPQGIWPEQEIRMNHGMGLLSLEDCRISPAPLYGHQGFAYGAVNGVFFDDAGNGFVSLNSGASERRVGHLSCLNRDLIRFFKVGETS